MSITQLKLIKNEPKKSTQRVVVQKKELDKVMARLHKESKEQITCFNTIIKVMFLYYLIRCARVFYKISKPIAGKVIGGFFPRWIGTLIWEFPERPTRLISEKMWELKEKTGESVTPEHFHARQNSGQDIFDNVITTNSYDFWDFYKAIMDCTQVHWVTRDENMRLRKLQRQGNHEIDSNDWQGQYKATDIKLFSYDKLMEEKEIKNMSNKLQSV